MDTLASHHHFTDPSTLGRKGQHESGFAMPNCESRATFSARRQEVRIIVVPVPWSLVDFHGGRASETPNLIGRGRMDCPLFVPAWSLVAE